MNETLIQKVFSSLGGAVQMGVHILLPFLHAGRVRWGATDEELQRTWPGDDMVPDPCAGFMQGITIHAPASKVYPWIAQIGQNKAGFYSYEILENIVGCQMHNTYRLVPEWQKLEVGSQLQMHPMGGIPITAVYPEQGYLTGGMLDADKGASLEPGAPLPEHIITISWLFYVYDISNGDSRFISRWRVKYPPSFKMN